MASLRSGTASFTPHLALLLFGSEAQDPAGIHALHELAHALPFAQSDFYAEFAAKKLSGKKVQLKILAPLLEAVPEALARLGERHSPGTLPDQAITKALVACATDYDEIFVPAWAAVGRDPREARSPAGDASRLSGLRLFNRTLVLCIVDVALQRAISEDDSESAAKTIYDLAACLAGRSKRLPLPTPAMTLKEHIAALLGASTSRMVSMFSDQFRLLKVLQHVGSPHFVDNMILLPAVVRIEFFLEYGDEHLGYSFLGTNRLIMSSGWINTSTARSETPKEFLPSRKS